MSFMVVECPWCGEAYTFGIVGTLQIGSGHHCRAVVDCIKEGCRRPGRYLVYLAYLNKPAEQVIACWEHARRLPIMGVQPGYSSACRGQQSPEKE